MVVVSQTTRVRVLGRFLLPSIQNKVPPEYSEVVLYEVMVMLEAGNYEEALKHISNFESDICDLLGLKEAKGRVTSG